MLLNLYRHTIRKSLVPHPIMAGKRARKMSAAVAVQSQSGSQSTAVVAASLEAAPVLRRSSRIRRTKTQLVETPVASREGVQREASPLSDLDDPPSPPKKQRRRKKEAEPVVYDIPPVESKTILYEGRLGYACLNTILRVTKPDPIFCSRTCRIDTILKNGLDFAKNLGIQNTKDLAKLIQWNEDNKIQFMRISSELFPFASHDKYGYSLDYAAAELKAAGDLAKSYGHRMTLHPGQFTQIGSPKPNVVEASLRELHYHCSILRHMGIGKDGVIIIHMGGVYGDKEATLARFKENYRTLLSEDIKARLVLENDEICYNADDLLPVCEELDIPLVFDYHHNWIYPSSEPLTSLIPRINAIWHKKGIKPKQHLSSPRPGAETVMEKRAHARRCSTLPAELEAEGAGWWWRAPGKREWVDLMIEAKDKEQAVFQLYRMYNLMPVIWENLRPEQTDAVGKRAGGTTSKTRRAEEKGDDEDETCPLDLPADVDPVAEVDAADPDIEPTTEEQVPKLERSGRPRHRASRKAKDEGKG
ncbi:UV-endonuclease UvdE-domain-containing protein [Gloeopeniophorella convolvens]|nr:UV-endonuclease UvdE-domain-containing protein [Gloeopeniophorella convolvens]